MFFTLTLQTVLNFKPEITPGVKKLSSHSDAESSSACHETIEIAPEIDSDGVVGVHGERQLSLRSSQGVGVVKQVLPDCSEAFEFPPNH